jgi:triosephosphate isomerase
MSEVHMRRPLVAGNWKMNKTVAEARVLVSGLLPGLTAIHEVEIVLCPPFTAILPIAAMLEGTSIGIGAQNMYWETSGAFTGEIAPTMLAEFCKYVIIGHSERRAYFGESDETVNKKIRAALKAKLIPIVCVGETLAENESGLTSQVVPSQVIKALEGIEAKEAASLVIAYEPVWAIGTGRAATAQGANAVIADHIRAGLARLYDDELAQQVQVLYGGSVKSGNAQEFFGQADIDGALVGGASLNAAEFISITRAAIG